MCGVGAAPMHDRLQSICEPQQPMRKATIAVAGAIEAHLQYQSDKKQREHRGYGDRNDGLEHGNPLIGDTQPARAEHGN